MNIINVGNNEDVTIMGVTFHGFAELRECAVKGIVKEGVYVAEDSERYPCFDSYDYDSENRRFWNFVFASSAGELQRKLELLKNMKNRGNYKKLHDETPAELLPMIYYGGDSHNPLEVAFQNN